MTLGPVFFRSAELIQTLNFIPAYALRLVHLFRLMRRSAPESTPVHSGYSRLSQA